MEQTLTITTDAQALMPRESVTLTRAPQALQVAAYQQWVTLDYAEIRPETYTAATECLREIKAQRKRVEQFHAGQKAPINAVREYALGLERTDLQPWQEIEKALGARILAYEVELERQRVREETRLRQEALAQAKLEADERAAALRAAARMEEDAAIKKALQQQARAVKESPIIAPAVELPSVTAQRAPGLRTRTTWSADLVDVRALVQAVARGEVPLDALEPERLVQSHPWLNAQAVQQRDTLLIPGVVPVQKTSL